MPLQPKIQTTVLDDRKALWRERSADPARLTAVPKKDGPAIAAAAKATPRPSERPRRVCETRNASAAKPSAGPSKNRPPLDSVSTIADQLRGKYDVGSALSPVEVHLHQQLPALERSLFAPSFASVGRSVASALFRPALLAAVLVAVMALPERTSFAVYPPVDGSTNSHQLASAFVDDHHGNKELRKAGYRTAAGWVSESDEVRLPILRELSRIEKPVVETTSALVSVPFELEKKATAAKAQTPAANDRRSLVKFISGLIAAFRPQLPDSAQIARHIVELSGNEHVDPLYIAAVIAIESRFSSSARSGVGATGLMQLMPMTAGELAERHNIRHRRGGLTDPRTNIQLGIRYLKEMEKRYKGNRFLALAAYNWGPGNVDQTRGRERNIPSSVRKYSQTILERTTNWRKHFARANESAELLAEATVPQTTS